MKNDYKEAMDKRNVDADFEINTINKLKSIRQEKIKRARRRSIYISVSSLAAAACLVFAIFTFSPMSDLSNSEGFVLAPAQEPAETSESPAPLSTQAPESEPNRTKTPEPLDRAPDTEDTVQNAPVPDTAVSDEANVDVVLPADDHSPQGPSEPIPEEVIVGEDIPLMDSGNSSPLYRARHNYAWVIAALTLSIACVSLAVVMLVRLALLKRREKKQGKE